MEHLDKLFFFGFLFHYNWICVRFKVFTLVDETVCNLQTTKTLFKSYFIKTIFLKLSKYSLKNLSRNFSNEAYPMFLWFIMKAELKL